MYEYVDLLRTVIDLGEPHADRTGIGTTSLFGHVFRHDMRCGFPLLTTKRVPLRLVAEELFWFLRGSSNVKELQDKNVHIWDEWATAEQCARFGRKAGDLGPVYGPLWRDFDGTDQILNLITGITNDPFSRRLIVTGWHPWKSKLVTLPPCHTIWQVKCHGSDELSLCLWCRSIDAFLGFPFDLASYGLLLTLLAKATNRKPRDLCIMIADLHIYNNHQEQVETLLSREPRVLPTLKVLREPPKSSASPKQRLDWLLSVKWEDLELTGYNPHNTIKADVAV